MVPNKAVYMARDLKLCAKYFDVPLKLPKVNVSVLALSFPKRKLLEEKGSHLAAKES